MKPVADMTPEELAGLVCSTLEAVGVRVTLTGGACVAIWSRGRYVSHDLDFIEEGPVPPRKVRAALGKIGFTRQSRHYVHPDTEYFVEFPTGPLMVGNERVEPGDQSRHGRRPVASVVADRLRERPTHGLFPLERSTGAGAGNSRCAGRAGEPRRDRAMGNGQGSWGAVRKNQVETSFRT